MATEFPERFFLLIHLRTSQNKSFVRKHLSRQIFDAATLSLGVGESAFAKSLSAKRHAQHSPQSGRWLFFGSFSMSGYLLIVDRIPSYHHLSLFQNCAHFSRACIRIFRVLVCCPKSLWKSWWFKLSGFNQSNSVSEFLLILGLPSLGVEQNRQPLLRLRFKESVHIALSHKNQMIETGCYINSEHADATSCSTNTSALSIFQMKSKSSTLRHHSTAKMTINGE